MQQNHRQLSALRCRIEVTDFKHNSWKGANLNKLCHVRQCEQFPLKDLLNLALDLYWKLNFQQRKYTWNNVNERQISVRITPDKCPTNRTRSSNLCNLTKINNNHAQEETTSNKIKLGFWNAQSLQKKSVSVWDIILSNKVDIFASRKPGWWVMEIILHSLKF